MSLNIRKIRGNLGGAGIALADTQGLFRCIAGTDRILTRSTVVSLVQGRLGSLQKPLRIGHFTGCGALCTGLLGGCHRLTGVAHVLHGCAGTCREQQYDYDCGKPRSYQEFFLHLDRRVVAN